MSQPAGIKPFVLNMNVGGNPFVVHAALLWDDQDLILVDTGIPGQLELIRETLKNADTSIENLTKIIITHQDMDHVGSLPELVQALDGKVEVLAHELTKPYLLGEVPTMKRGVVLPPAKVDTILHDGDILPYCGGIQVIYTPGHTPDHISLYHIPSKTLISGDALTSHDGVLMPPDPNFTPNMPQALESLTKLQSLEIDQVITYHGGVCTEGIQARISEIIKG
ncbi:MBL fold metallo-hydrolase [Paenibacillus hexagrammi]|uniref:MBL fold metallo-hydrolase n=1 Tax=Paenibacillus hexagrammi TaxID=2908839 RepID=A0ABY3SPS1_9BACL|nr:MBL fold metallo-hydrolase [Paenibacillus sp. YPD9-1]UJF35458.1 MBL fold metallo-hydrolase [Paenibacillus sp. YPD9-1]